MDLTKNLILNTDSYKYSQYNQYPPQTEGVYSYIESRGGKHDETLFFGLQMFIKDYLLKPIRMEDIDIAEEIVTAHGEPFYRGGWEYIVKKHGGHLYSADNIAFGQGGGLLQMVNRDDFKFAMKCSAVNVGGTWRDVFKDPITDPGKTSKKGRLQLIKDEAGNYQTVPERPWNKDELVTVYDNGQLLVDYTLEQVRVNASQCLHNFFTRAD